MNNLYRELAPISEAAWAEIEEEARRTLKRHLAARRVVDVEGPKGFDFSAVGTGHTQGIPAPGEGIQAVRREVKALVELRVPVSNSPARRLTMLSAARTDSDWSSVKDAARKIAFAEDNSVFEGYDAAGIQGIRQGNSNPVLTLPSSVRGYPDVVAQAVSQLRLAGVQRPLCAVLGADPYTAVNGGSDEGYPVLQHIQRLIDGEIIWAPAIRGGFVLTTRGGDFELDLGQDISIGYLSHSETSVRLYLQESFTFRLLTTEAAVALSPAEK
jgi:uncharacterized linocin/CFP29 family protein